MAADPYAAPKSKVDDVSPEPVTHLLRAKWFTGAGLVVICSVIALIHEPLLESTTAACLIASLALTLFICFHPLRFVLARQSGSPPWWWDVLFYSILALAFLGVELEDYSLVVVGFLPFVGFFAASVALMQIVETRYGVRIYSKARGIAVVRNGDG